MTTRKRDVWLGAFVVAAVTGLFAVVLILGQRQSLFHRKVHLRTTFADTSGLVSGSAVRLAGVDVGVVERISFDPDPRFRKVHVQLGVNSAYTSAIRADSVAHLTSKGLLGDMVIDIDLGSADARPLHDGDELPSQEADSLTSVVRALQGGIEDVRKLTQSATQRLDAVVDDTAVRDVHRIVRSVADLTDDVAHGDNIAHALTHEPELAAHLRGLAGSGRRAADGVASVADKADRILGSDEAQHLPADMRRVLLDADRALNSKGLLTRLFSDEASGRMVDDLMIFSDNLKLASDTLVRGDGTLGALLRDPTVYGDLKLILGNARRSRILRWLIRFAIRHDGLRAQ